MNVFNRLMNFFGLVALSAVALAQPATGDPLESKLVARKVVVTNGKETLVEAKGAKPGEVIEYAVTYRNKGTAPLRDLQVTLPIPANTEFIPGSPSPATAKASVDGVRFQDLPLTRRERTAAGVEVERPVPLAEYRALRWFPGAIASGSQVTFSARVKVADNEPAAPPAGPRKGGSP